MPFLPDSLTLPGHVGPGDQPDPPMGSAEESGVLNEYQSCAPRPALGDLRRLRGRVVVGRLWQFRGDRFVGQFAINLRIAHGCGVHGLVVLGRV